MRHRSIKSLLAIHFAALAVAVVYALLPIGCPIKYFLHFDCPACGSTRAIFSLLRGDVRGYFDFNPMALPLLLLVLFGLHKGLFGLHKRTERIILISGAAAVFAVYVLRAVKVI